MNKKGRKMSSKVNINKVDLKLFIKTVQKYEAVWNRNCESYRDYRLRETAWHDIAKETNFGDVRRAKIQWKKLRDNHRDALKRRKFNNQERHWVYQNLMEFLLPHMHSYTSDISYIDDIDTGGNHDSETADNFISDTEKLAKIAARIKRENVSNPLEFSGDDEDPIMEYIDEQDQDDEDKKWEEKGDESNSTDVLDAVDHFFASVCQSTKKLPLAAQLRLKKKIMNLVIEEEELMLTSLEDK